MPITIVDPDLESRLEAMGRKQPVPAKKAAMAKAILRRAVESLEWPEHRDSASVKQQSAGRSR